MHQKLKYNKGIDGLRAIAILLVPSIMQTFHLFPVDLSELIYSLSYLDILSLITFVMNFLKRKVSVSLSFMLEELKDYFLPYSFLFSH